MNKTKILYICGETRSGSTILSNILGCIEGFFNGGEIIEFWKTGLEWPCSCGKMTDQCRIWSKIYQSVSAYRNFCEFQQMNQFISQSASSLKSFRSIFSSKYYSRIKDINICLIDNLHFVYKQIQYTTGCKVIVDASKNPGYAQLLAQFPDTELYIIHIIRDPRATIYSWKIKKPGLWTASAKEIAMRWNIRNAATELFRTNPKTHYYQLKYEKFAVDPLKHILAILDFIQEEPQRLPFITENEVLIENIHGLCGNPDRFKQGKIKITLDQKWIHGLARKDKLFSLLVNMPFLFRYHFPVFGMPSTISDKLNNRYAIN
jgi:hypothetical protein